MGGASPSKCYSFENSIYDGIDLKNSEVYVITEEANAEWAVDRLKNCEILYVDGEFHHFGKAYELRLGLIQVAKSAKECYIFDTISCERSVSMLKQIFESDRIKKVFHNCTSNVAELHKLEIDVNAIEDTQVAYKIIQMSRSGSYDSSDPGLSINVLYENLLHKPFPNTNTEHPSEDHITWISNRPLTEQMIAYAAINVLLLPSIYEQLKQSMSGQLKPEYRFRIMERQRPQSITLLAGQQKPDENEKCIKKEFFVTSLYGDIDLNECNVREEKTGGPGIDKTKRKISVVDNLHDALFAVRRLQNFKTIYVACEVQNGGRNEMKIGLIQIAPSSNECFIFDVVSCAKIIEILRGVLQSDANTKVFHNFSKNMQYLQNLGIFVKNIEDTVLASEEFPTLPSDAYYKSSMENQQLKNVYERFLQKPFPTVRNVDPSTDAFLSWISTRPITEDIIKYAASNVLLLPELHARIQKLLPSEASLKYEGNREESKKEASIFEAD